MKFQQEMFKCPNLSRMTQPAAATAIAKEIKEITGGNTSQKTILNWIRGERTPVGIAWDVATKAVRLAEQKQAQKTQHSPLNQKTPLKLGRLA